jgi:ATP-dependent Clp protease ATP-binding subunit ClpC
MKRVVEIAFDEARKQPSAYVGTEHLLLGILIEGEGIAATALRETGVTVDTVRNELGRLLEESSEH